MKHTNIGSISTATLRNQDLVPLFLNTLKETDRTAYEKVVTCSALKALTLEDDDVWWQSDDSFALLDSLFDALDESSPPYFHFGAHEGDGADFGWWLSHDALDEEFSEYGDGLRVSDTSEVPDNYTGEVLRVSDHGNATLYVADGKGNLEEQWGVV